MSAWILFLLTAGTALCGTHGEIRVDIYPENDLSGDRILLGDIARIYASEGLARKIGALDMGRAPRPGKEKKIPGKRIAAIIRSGKLIPPDAVVTIPDSIHIRRAFQTIPETLLKRVFNDYLAKNLGDAEYEISRFDVRGKNAFPVGDIRLSVSNSGGKKLRGGVRLRVAVSVDDKDYGHLTLAGRVDRFTRAVCARRPVAQDEILTNADLELKKIKVSQGSHRYMASLGEAVGKQARLPIRAGAFVRTNMVTSPELIRKGDRVKILAVSGNLRVATIGVAKESGALGDQVRVENIASGKTVVGRVNNGAVVEVLF